MKNKFMAKLTALGLMLAMLLSGCGSVDVDATVITINDGETTISYGYANFVAKYMQAIYDEYYVYFMGEDVWESEYSDGVTWEDSLKESILSSIEQVYILLAHADEYGVSLTDEEEAEILEAAAAFIESNSASTLEMMTATEEIVAQYLRNQKIAYMVELLILEETELTITDEDAAQRSYTYVSFSVEGTEEDDDGNVIDLTDDEIAAIEEEAYALAEADDFDDYVEEMEYTSTSDHYGVDDEPFNEVVMEVLDEMTDGEIQVIYDEDDLCYYVIRLDAEYDEEATAEVRAELEEEEQEEHYSDVLDEWEAEMTFDVDETLWAKIKFDSHYITETEDEDEEEEE